MPIPLRKDFTYVCALLIYLSLLLTHFSRLPSPLLFSPSERIILPAVDNLIPMAITEIQNSVKLNITGGGRSTCKM